MSISTPTRNSICIFDLEFSQFSPASSRRPGMYPMLISAYYKSKGYTAVFSTTVPNFANYTYVFIVRDLQGISYLSEWLREPNVKLVGRYWSDELRWEDERWNEVEELDPTIYGAWKNNQDTLSELFNLTPFRMVRGNKIVEPNGKRLVIVDSELDRNLDALEILTYSNLRQSQLGAPLWVDGTNYLSIGKLLRERPISLKSIKLEIDATFFELEHFAHLEEEWGEIFCSIRRNMVLHFFTRDYSWNEQLYHIFNSFQFFFPDLPELEVEAVLSPFPNLVDKLLKNISSGRFADSYFDRILRRTNDNNTLDFLSDPSEVGKWIDEVPGFIDFCQSSHPELLTLLTTPLVDLPPQRPRKFQRIGVPRRMAEQFAPIENLLFQSDRTLLPQVRDMIENRKNKYPRKASDRWNL